MDPYRNAAVATALLAALGGASSESPPVRLVKQKPVPVSAAVASGLPRAACPAGFLPDGKVCISFRDVVAAGGPELEARRNMHHDRHGRAREYDQVPKQPERPASYDAYQYPIAIGEKAMVSGYDLDRDDADQRRGAHLSAVGHGGVDLLAKRGAEVRSLALEHQEGEAEVLYVGVLFGTSVVTRHTVREGTRMWDYVVIHGHLDAARPGLVRGARIPPGDLIGFVGDTGSEGLVHLHLETRRVREGLDPREIPPGKLAANDQSIVVDPRNVLPLR